MKFKRLSHVLLKTILLVPITASAATFTVTKITDTNDGVCDADCSLREAMAAANGAASNDIIQFDSVVFAQAQTIVSANGAFEINNNGSLTINGTGSDNLTIAGNNTVHRVLMVNSTATVVLNDLKFTGGNFTSGVGAGIYNPDGDLTINRCSIVGNTGSSGIYNNGTLRVNDSFIGSNSGSSEAGAINNQENAEIIGSTISGNSGNPGGIRNGGTMTISGSSISSNTGIGILAFFGSLTLSNSTVASNTGSGIQCMFGGNVSVIASTISGNSGGSLGGGIDSTGVVSIVSSLVTGNSASRGAGLQTDNGSASIQDSRFVGNNASSGGGGIYIGGGQATISNTEISGNTAGNTGGGIANESDTTITVTNSTISGNSANGSLRRGGGVNASGSATFTNVTINNNNALLGGGVFTAGTNVKFKNCLIGDNSATGSGADFDGSFTSLGFNLIENVDQTIINGDTSGNILGRDPQLLPLRTNGGPTQTVGLMATSPAIDAGDPNNPNISDQRGLPRVADGDWDEQFRQDIGAYERQSDFAFMVFNTDDTAGSTCNITCSLRQAVTAANSSNLPDKSIIFERSTFATDKTITLTLGELNISSDIGIFFQAEGSLTINGGNVSRIANVAPGASLGLRKVTLANGTGIGSISSGSGGAVLVQADGRLGLIDSILRNNRATIIGGGAVTNRGKLYSLSSTFSENVAEGAVTRSGGAIYIQNGSGEFIRTVLQNNSAISSGTSSGGDGGAISAVGSETVMENCWIHSNSAQGVGTSHGGAIFNNAGRFTIFNSTIERNTVEGQGGGINNNVGGILILKNSTISRNIARNRSGTLFSTGGGIANVGSNETPASGILENVTVAFNLSENNGGGISSSNPSTLTTSNSIIGRNQAPIAPDFGGGTLSSGGYNLIQNTNGLTISGITTGNILGVDPQIDPILRMNGGTTPNHGLRPTSPVIDKGKAITGMISDQRGSARPFDFPTIANASGGNGSDIGAFERRDSDAIVPAAPFDYDGDGKSDISVWRPSEGTWYIIQSGSSSVRAQGWGLAGDKLTPADFDGDGKTDLSVFRESDSNWYIFNSATNTVTTAGWGLAGDLPVPADYGGDGKADLAVYRPSEGKWYRRDSDGKLHIYEWGLPGDKPAPADFNGDGVSDMTVFRPSEGKWYILNSGNAAISEFTWGLNGDLPIPGDYSGDGKSDFAVFRPSNQTWYRIHSDTFQIHIITWGLPGDFPTPGDYDGDGRNDLAVFRPSNSTWFINSSTGGIYSQPFGLSGDIPVENAFVY